MRNEEHGSDPWRPAGNEWPLLFLYRVPVTVQGSVAIVELSGRATAYVDEDGPVWLDGVNPGAFAASGDSLKDAEVDLRKTLTEIFLDIAEESGDLAEFRQIAEDFLCSTDDESVSEWEAALSRVRKSTGIGVAGLKRRSADQHRPSVQVTSGAPQVDAPLLLTDRPESLEISAAA